jgi:hypothetical protein
MSVEYPPTFNTSIFNNSAFNDEETFLTLEDADKRYLQKIGGTITGDLTIQFENNTTNLVDYQLWRNNLATDIDCVLRISNIGSWFGNSTNHPLRIATNNTIRMTIDATGNVNINNHNGSSVGLELGGTLVTATATELNYNDISIIGTAQASKALVVDSSRNIININELTATASLNVIRATNGECFTASNGTVRTAIHQLSSSSHIGTTTNHNFNIQANGNTILRCLANGDLDITNNCFIYNKLALSNNSSTAITGTTIAQNYAISLQATTNTNGAYLTTGIAFSNETANAIPNGALYLDRISSSGNGDMIIGCREATNNLIEVLRARYLGNVLINTSKSQTNAGIITATGNSNFTDGAYQVVSSFFTSDGLSNVQTQIAIAGDAFYGTKTNHKFALMTNNNRAMTIDINQRVGVGTASPSTILHVSGTVSNTVAVGTYAQATNAAYNASNLTPVTFSSSLRTTGAIWSGGDVYIFSDRRIKKNIEFVNDDYSEAFFNNINICKFNYKNQEEGHNKSLGLIAQDVLKNGYMELINMVENPEMKAEEEDDLEGYTMNVAYDKIALLCVMEIKKLKNKIKNMQEYIDSLVVE